MKKIPTLFKRTFENHKVVGITDEITPGCEEAFLRGVATIKYDGSCCAIIDGGFYKRFDAKPGRKIPEGAIPCCESDPITCHHPHWVKVDSNNPADKWFIEALDYYVDKLISMDYIDFGDPLPDGTYEAIGPHFNGNPYNLVNDTLVLHGYQMVDQLNDCKRSFDDIKAFLQNNNIEGIVFWLDGEPVCKIKRTDFGLPWPVKE